MTKALELAKFGRESAPAGVVVGDSDTQTLSAKTFSDGPVFSAGIVDGVAYLNGSKALTTSSNLTFNGTLLTVSDLRDSSLTAGRITYAGTAGNLVDSAALTFDGNALTLGGSAPLLRSNMSGGQSTRFGIQNSTVNGNTRFYLYPNGTGTISAINLWNNSDPNAANYSALDVAIIGTQDARFSSNASGTGAVLPFTWYLGASEQMRLTTSGNLLLGTVDGSTNGRLTVFETTNARLYLTDSTLGTTYGGQVRGYGVGGAGGHLELGVVDNNVYNSAVKVFNQATQLSFYTNNGANGYTAERLRIDNTGRVLVGSTSGRGGSTSQYIFRIPTGSSYFEIQQQSTSGTTDVLFTDGASGNYGIVGYDHSVDALRMYTNSTEKLRITSAGYVGIGTADPQSLLTVNSGGTDNLAAATINQTTDFAATSRAGFSGLTNNNGGFYFGMGANGTGIPAGFGFFREASGWNTALAFYTNNQTSGTYSTRAMQEKMRLDSDGNLNLLTTGYNDTNTSVLPGALKFTGSGWNTNFGAKPMGGQISLAGVYSQLNGGSTEPSLVFSLYGTGSNGYSGNDGPTTLTERMRINNYGKVTVTGNIVSTLGGPIYETIDCLNINPAGTGFDSIGNNSDGGATSWQVVGGRVVDLYSTSGGHGGSWGYPVRIDTPGYYRLKIVARLSSTNGAIHGSTSASNYKYNIPIGFVLNTFSVYGKWDVDALGNGTRVCAIGTPAYCSAGTYQMSYSTSGYDGIKQIYLYEVVVERVG